MSKQVDKEDWIWHYPENGNARFRKYRMTCKHCGSDCGYMALASESKKCHVCSNKTKTCKDKHQQKLAKEGKRKCSKCLRVKDLPAFYNSKKDTSGKRSRCIACCKQEITVGHMKYNSRGHEQHLKRTYGITLEDFNKMCELQDYHCRCCSDKPDKLYVDHDHRTNEIRGLLCQKCNSGIGLLGDSLQGIKDAISYLEEYNERGCLRNRI